MERKILLTITTTHNSDWKEKLKNIDCLKIEEIAVFLTGLEKKERKEFYSLLEKTNVKSIPFVHIRGDMSPEELDYFIEKYNTKIFNTHISKKYPFEYDYSNYRDKIYIENIDNPFNEEDLKGFGGICLDLGHLENDRILDKERYEGIIKQIEGFKIGCNHISAIKKESNKKESKINKNNNESYYDSHYLNNLSELDYLKNYPSNYFSSFIAIELENNLKEQLEVKKYLENILM